MGSLARISWEPGLQGVPSPSWLPAAASLQRTGPEAFCSTAPSAHFYIGDEFEGRLLDLDELALFKANPSRLF